MPEAIHLIQSFVDHFHNKIRALHAKGNGRALGRAIRQAETTVQARSVTDLESQIRSNFEAGELQRHQPPGPSPPPSCWNPRRDLHHLQLLSLPIHTKTDASVWNLVCYSGVDAEPPVNAASFDFDFRWQSQARSFYSRSVRICLMTGSTRMLIGLRWSMNWAGTLYYVHEPLDGMVALKQRDDGISPSQPSRQSWP